MMGNAKQTTEAILEATQALILESGGDAACVTIRQIANRAGISVGLVNHYYASKELLLEACVQRMIGGVIDAFQPVLPADASLREKLNRIASQVTDFLIDNPQISRISILGDMRNPDARDNTMGTVFGLSNTISGGASDRESGLRAFCLVAILQAAFLRKDVILETMGLDYHNKQDRDAFLARAVKWILNEEENTHG